MKNSEKLTLREKISIPKGTTFYLDNDLALDAIDDFSKYDQFKEIGEININENKHIFTCFDLSILDKRILSEWIARKEKNETESQLFLLGYLLRNRYPYQEDDELLFGQ